jgi:hypothetical protein
MTNAMIQASGGIALKRRRSTAAIHLIAGGHLRVSAAAIRRSSSSSVALPTDQSRGPASLLFLRRAKELPFHFHLMDQMRPTRSHAVVSPSRNPTEDSGK